jgi:hypothetical protein
MPRRIRLEEQPFRHRRTAWIQNFLSPTLHDEFGIEILEKEKSA